MKRIMTLILFLLFVVLCVSSVTATWVYQEDANSTSYSGSWDTPALLTNGLWDVYTAGFGSDALFYANYSTPVGANGLEWRVAVDQGTIFVEQNESISSSHECWNDTLIQLFINDSDSAGQTYAYCYSYDTGLFVELPALPMGEGLYEEAVFWNFTGCAVDTDCGSCEWCNAGVCENQTHTDNKSDCPICNWCDGWGECFQEDYGEDIKNDCDVGCVDDWTFTDGWCGDQTGACFSDVVTEGNVCVGGADEDPDAEHNCGTWGDCIEGNTSADEYYVGYDGGGIGNCVDADWKSSGTFWNVTEGYEINVTEHADTCSEEEIPEAPLEEPEGYSANYTASDLPYVATDLLGETGVQLKAQMPLAILILATGVGVGAYYGIKRLWR